MVFPHAKTLQIIGKQNSGKTTLLRFLISALNSRNIRVGAFKHSAHDHPLDKSGSDSELLRKAGAHPAAFMSQEGTAFFFSKNENNDIPAITGQIYKDCDIVLIESFHELEGPRILIGDTWPDLPNKEHIIATIESENYGDSHPSFKRNDAQLIEFIIDHFNL